MKNILIVFLLFPIWLFGQVKDAFRRGIYTSIEQLKQRKPSGRKDSCIISFHKTAQYTNTLFFEVKSFKD
jgi:hypothetical protein